MSFPLTGLIGATYTPMTESGALNLQVVQDLADIHLETKMTGVFVCGTTGECHSLSTDERMQVTEAWCETADDKLTLLVHVGSNCQSDAIEMAKHARDAGAHGIAAMASFFFRPSKAEALVEYLEPIAAAGGELPFYFYHIPMLTHVDLNMPEFLQLAVDRIPNFAGLKFTCGDIFQLQQCVAMSEGRFDVLFGLDENHLTGLTAGVRGVIGSTYNYAAPVYHRVRDAFFNGDLQTAQEEQAQAVEFVAKILPFGILESGKAIMKMLGVDCGPVRAPLKTLCDVQANELYEAIKTFDVFPRELRSPSNVNV